VRIALVAALAAIAGAFAAPASRAADECRGLQVCIPVAGPWVVVPAENGFPAADWELKCPEGVVGGLDARVSDRRIAVHFPGRLGSPVNPGITTTTSVVFNARYTGPGPKATTYRPFIGCVPVSGGGRRTPTAVRRTTELIPGEPLTTRVLTLRVIPGRLARLTHSCRAGERLVRATHAVGLYTQTMPPPDLLFGVEVVQTIREDQILISARRPGLPADIRAEVQVHAECAR
jgi:hypothetical protein